MLLSEINKTLHLKCAGGVETRRARFRLFAVVKQSAQQHATSKRFSMFAGQNLPEEERNRRPKPHHFGADQHFFGRSVESRHLIFCDGLALQKSRVMPTGFSFR